METLTDSVIMPCAFHYFLKDIGKPQCLLVVDKSTTITTSVYYFNWIEMITISFVKKEQIKISTF